MGRGAVDSHKDDSWEGVGRDGKKTRNWRKGDGHEQQGLPSCNDGRRETGLPFFCSRFGRMGGVFNAET